MLSLEEKLHLSTLTFPLVTKITPSYDKYTQIPYHLKILYLQYPNLIKFWKYPLNSYFVFCLTCYLCFQTSLSLVKKKKKNEASWCSKLSLHFQSLASISWKLGIHYTGRSTSIFKRWDWGSSTGFFWVWNEKVKCKKYLLDFGLGGLKLGKLNMLIWSFWCWWDMVAFVLFCFIFFFGLFENTFLVV